MCHTRGRGGQCNSEETIPLDHKAREVSYGHVNGTLPEEATL